MTAATDIQRPAEGELLRAIDWRGAFWVASGVPALVLFSIGGIAGTTGKVAFMIWIVSMIMLRSILHLRRDRGPLSGQIGWRFDLWRGSLGTLLEIDRSAVGVVSASKPVSPSTGHCAFENSA
jgi:hypothetical protein